jgi:hypothetical protein
MMRGGQGNKGLVIITKYFAPVNNVDSNSVYDLCQKLLLIDSTLKIHIVTTSINYKSNVKLRDFDNSIISKLSIHRVKLTSIFGHFSFLRVFYDALTGILLTIKARRLKVNTIISLSNPPMVNTWCSLLLKKRKYLYWSFDLFPEALFANNLLNPGGLVGRGLNWLTYSNSPKGIIALGHKQFDYLISCYSNKNIEKILLPCGIHNSTPSNIIPEWYSEDKIILGYIGNLGKAHSRDFLLNIIKEISKNKDFLLIVSVYGDSTKEILNTISQNNPISNIRVVNSVLQSELVYIDIHLVSLLDKWNHVSVPSKAVSAVCSNSALWFNGSIECDTYSMFQDCSYHSEADPKSVSGVLNSISRLDLNVKKQSTKSICKELNSLEHKSVQHILRLTDL